MKETGIIMSGDHPKLILDEIKTMTQRTWGLKEINAHPEIWKFLYMDGAIAYFKHPTGTQVPVKCPYGQVGDRLWVRETVWVSDCGKYYCYINQASGDIVSEQARYTDKGTHRIYRFSVLSRPDPDKKGYAFRRWFGDVDEEENIVSRLEAEFHRKKPSIHMPRWASRILLEITEVRVERLQEISREDARAEGMRHEGYWAGDVWHTSIGDFHYLWDKLNAKRGYGWDMNPWVWPIGFKLLEGKV